MTEEEKRLWAYFLNVAGVQEYCELCKKCRNDCKQSFRIIAIKCPKYQP
ncbi:MAG: hypothetical protein PHX08_17290 [Lachnospiraceae bacterium]|nr:hypothetical protein [Lachnospiraceae bacterium]